MNTRKALGAAAATIVMAVAGRAAVSQFGVRFQPLAPPPVTLGGYYAPGWAPPSVVADGAWHTGTPAEAYVPWTLPGEVAGAETGNPFGAGPIPRTSERIDARFEADNRLLVRWAGDGRLVARITFALLDRNRTALSRQVVTRLPAEARLRLTNKTAYYQVLVEYVNGTTSSFVSPV